MSEDGVPKITWGVNRAEIGPSDGHFVTPDFVANEMIAKSGCNIAKLENLLDIEKGELGSNPVRPNMPGP